MLRLDRFTQFVCSCVLFVSIPEVMMCMIAILLEFVAYLLEGVDWGVKGLVWLQLSRTIKGDWVAGQCDCLEALGGTGLHDSLLQLGLGFTARSVLWLNVPPRLASHGGRWRLLMLWLLCHQSWRIRDSEDASARSSIYLGLTFVVVRGSWGNFDWWTRSGRRQGRTPMAALWP